MTRRVLRAITRVVTAVWATVVLLSMVAVAAAALAGWQLTTIDSPSMGPAVPEGSLAIVRPSSSEAIETGDVVAFEDPVTPERHLLHRVIGDTLLPDGRRFLRTQGDGNATPDALPVATGAVDGELAWHVPNLGRVVWMMRPPAGLLILVGVPLVGTAATGWRRWACPSTAGRAPAATAGVSPGRSSEAAAH